VPTSQFECPAFDERYFAYGWLRQSANRFLQKRRTATALFRSAFAGKWSGTRVAIVPDFPLQVEAFAAIK